MAFRNLTDYTPLLTSVDPRIDAQWMINSNHCVIAVSPYPTLKELNNKEGLKGLKLLGLVSGYTMNESIAFMSVHEIGNKRAIIIPGKLRGNINLNSNMIESVNLLGGIFETVLEGLVKRDIYKGVFSKPVRSDTEGGGHNIDFVETILFRPELNKTYDSLESVSPSSNLGGDLSDPLNISGNPSGEPTAATAASSTSKGAILLSIDDVRLKLRFGLCFVMFQSEKRIPKTSISQTFNSVEESNLADIQDITDPLGAAGLFVEDQLTRYRILGGQFYENCLLTDYSRTVSSDPMGGNISESASIVYNGTKKLIQNMKETNQTLDI